MQEVVRREASDLHLTVGQPPILRVNGELQKLEQKLLTVSEIKEMVGVLCDEIAAQRVRRGEEVDLAYTDPNTRARFRVNVYRHQGALAAALRLIPARIRTLEELNLPSSLARFAELKQGFVLIVGPTGHGKTTTMASLVNLIHQQRTEHIVTIEDPIEYIFGEGRCLIHQREVHRDTRSFAAALRATLREDPDVVMVGEMRDLETIATALTIAETGHLVFATLHTNDSSQTIDRIIDVFPAAQQNQIRVQLAAELSGIISQRLLPAVEGGRLPAVEVLIATPAVRTAIREMQTHLIPGMLQTGKREGMVTLDQALLQLVEGGKVRSDDAARYARDPAQFVGQTWHKRLKT